MTFAFLESMCILEKHVFWIRVKHLYFGVKKFHLFLKSVKCYFPTRIYFVVVWAILILTKYSVFVNHVRRLHTLERFEMNVFMTKISFRLFYCCDTIFWI